jgi:hypothetical protein
MSIFDAAQQQLRQLLVESIVEFSSTEMNSNISFLGLYCDLYHGIFDICLDDYENMMSSIARDRSEVMNRREEMLRAHADRPPANYYLTSYRNRFVAHTKFFADFKYPFLHCVQFPEWEDYTRGQYQDLPQDVFEERALHLCWLVLDDLSCSNSIGLLNRSPLLRLGFEIHDDDRGVIVTHELPLETVAE